MGNDSVVIMTTSQGRKINELFEKNDKDLVKLKDSNRMSYIETLNLKLVLIY